MVKVAAYLLGEYGRLIANNGEASPARMFELLHSHFSQVTEPTKAILLSTYLKFCKEWPQLFSKIQPIYKKFASQIDQEVQQRSVEYLGLLEIGESLVVRLAS